MENSVRKAQIAIGNGLLPAIAPVTAVVSKAAVAVGNFASEYPNLTGAVLGGTGVIFAGAAAVSALMWAYSGLRLAVIGTKNAYVLSKSALLSLNAATKLNTVATKGLALAQLAFNSVLAACPIGWLIIGVSALTVAGVALYRNWDKVKAFFSTMWDNPIVKLMLFASGPVGWLIAVPTYVIAHWDELGAYLNYFWDNPRAALFRFTSWVREELTGAVKWVEEKWNGIRNFLSQPIFGSVNITASGKEGQKVAQNAYGGIYGKGAFLTSFAERDGESAIPHTPNRRNVGLLAATNAIMGNPLGGVNINAAFNPQITVQGGTSDTAAQIDNLLAQKMREFEDMLKRVAAQQRRLSYD